MDKLLTPEHKAMAASWFRVFIAATVALYSTGVTDPAVLLNAGVAALIPVVIRYFNKKDPAYGLVATGVLTKVGEATAKAAAASTKKAPAKTAATPVKKTAPAKKAAPKK
jgi:hypothetical protein